jgi:hypothetical protein
MKIRLLFSRMLLLAYGFLAAAGCADERCQKVETPASLPITGRAVLDMRVRNAMSEQYELMAARVALDETPLAELARPKPCYREIRVGGVALPGGSHRVYVDLDVRGACWGFSGRCGQRFRVEGAHEVALEDDQALSLDVVLRERPSPDPKERVYLDFIESPGESFWKE